MIESVVIPAMETWEVGEITIGGGDEKGFGLCHVWAFGEERC